MARLTDRMNHSQSPTYRIIERTPIAGRRPTCLSRKTNTHILRWRSERKRKETCNPHRFRQHQQTIQHPLNKYPSVLYTLVAIRHSLAANSLFIEDNVKGFRGISRLRRITEGVLRTTGGRSILSTLNHSHQINHLCVAIRAIAT